MRLHPNTRAMTVVLALLTSLAPLSTDLYLPSLPAIAAEFGQTAAQAQLTLSAFLVGFALGQVFWGAWSDRIGRRPILIGGLALFCVATLGCAITPSLDVLIALRFLQALGASGPIVLARAMVRDLYEGRQAARELARMATIMGVVPAIAPVAGGVLQAWFGWRSTFDAALLFGLALLVPVLAALPETLRTRSPDPLSIPGMIRGFGHLLRLPAYRAYVGLSTLTYSGLFAWISGSSFVLQEVYGLSAIGFALSFCLVVAGYVSGTVIAQRLVERQGPERTIAFGVGCLLAGGLLMAAGSLAGLASPLALLIPMAVYTAGVGLVLPPSMALAMAPFPERAGAASSFLGVCQMTVAAIVGALVGGALGGTARPMVGGVALLGALAFALFHATRATRRTAP